MFWLLACTVPADLVGTPLPDIGETGRATGPWTEGVEASLVDEVQSVVEVRWEQLEPATVSVEFSVDPGEWSSSPALERAAGHQSALLLGVPYDTTVTFHLSIDSEADEDHSIATGEAPADLPLPLVTIYDHERVDPDLHWLLGSINGDLYWWTFIIDRRGRLVWARPTPLERTTMHPRPSYDGSDILIDQGSFWGAFDNGDASQVERVKIDGSVVALYDTPGLHHPFTEIEGGTLIWTARPGDEETIEELTPDGDRRTIWACTDLHEQLGLVEYCGSNTIWWNDQTDTFLYSSFSTSTIVEVDHGTGESLRWFGHLPESWSFAEEDTSFWWQHGAQLTEDGHLLVSARESESAAETVVREYSLDERTRTLTQVFSFGEGEGVYGRLMGEAWILDNGNVLHNYGTGARVREATREGEVVWELNWDAPMLWLGRTNPVSDLYAFAP